MWKTWRSGRRTCDCSTPRELLFKSIRTVMIGEYWSSREAVADLLRYLLRTPSEREPNVPIQRFGLTPTEREIAIVKPIVAGHANREIAENLAISENTVSTT